MARHPEAVSADFANYLLITADDPGLVKAGYASALHDLRETLLDCGAWGQEEALADRYENDAWAVLPPALKDRLRPALTARTPDLKVLEDPALHRIPPRVRSALISHMAMGYVRDYRTSHRAQSLDSAIALYRSIADPSAPECSGPAHIRYLCALAEAFTLRALRTGTVEDLTSAAGRFRKALALTPPRAARHQTVLVSLAGVLKERYRLAGDPGDLEEAVQLCTAAFEQVGTHDELLLGMCHLLESTGILRDDHGVPIGDMSLLAGRIQLCFDFTVQSDAARSTQYLALGDELNAWYQRTFEIPLIDLALTAYDRAEAFAPSEGTEVWAARINRGMMLGEQYVVTGDSSHLERAAADLEHCRQELPRSSPLHLDSCVNLSVILRKLYKSGGDAAALERSREVIEEAEGSAPADWPGRSALHMGLSDVLFEEFQRSGRAADLDRCFDLLIEVLDATPQQSVKRPGRLVSAGVAGRARFLNFGDVRGLDAALEFLREAADLLPEGSPNRVLALTNLTTALIDHHQFGTRGGGGAGAELDEAVRCASKAVAEAPANSVYQLTALANLGMAYDSAARQHGSHAYLDRAVDTGMKAVGLARQHGADHLVRAWHSLGVSLHLRFAFTRGEADLDEAIKVTGQALAGLAEGSPRRAAWLRNLGNMHQERWGFSRRRHDLEQGVSSYRAACRRGLVTDPAAALLASQGWALWAERRTEWAEAAEAYGYALDAIRALSQQQLGRGRKERWLATAQGIPARAAHAYALAGLPDAAVEALEAGQATLIAEALGTTDAELNALATQHAGLAERYREAVDALRMISGDGSTTAVDPAAPAASAACLRRGRADLDEVVDEIRRIQGHAGFGARLGADALRQLADTRPLLYLAGGQKEGFALLVRGSGPVLFRSLPGLSSDLVRERARGYSSAQIRSSAPGRSVADLRAWASTLDEVTAWLWEVAVGPLASDLPEDIVAVPCGPLSILPLHAAWTMEEGSRRYALDRMRFSYAPNARALLAARARLTARPGGQSSESAFVVADPSLPSSKGEAEVVSGFFPAARIRSTADVQAADALREAAQHDVAHFACHGRADLQHPLNSCLALAPGNALTLDKILQATLSTRLAVLSACQTALPGAALPDEVVGLPGGLLQAGCSGVVGSLWSVPDNATAELMRHFYRNWRSERQEPHRALVSAQQAVRDTPGGRWRHPYYWAAFGYYGV
ncbi:CHAT domain-containing protein [Streptomyces sp. T-3]|nr:CHAT domain-containing protein [Streptomyces sp. T-3]